MGTIKETLILVAPLSLFHHSVSDPQTFNEHPCSAGR